MNFSIFTAIACIGLIASWATKSLEDGKITLDEGLDLLMRLGAKMGLPMSTELLNMRSDLNDLNNINSETTDLDDIPETEIKKPLQE